MEKKPINKVFLVAAAGGLGLLVTGSAQIYRPLGYIVSGIVLLLWCSLYARKASK